MLQRVLKDMYIDPDILAELTGKQKKILFYKKRQEQIRRYNQYEKNDNRKLTTKTKPGKKVRFLEDGNGNLLISVMEEMTNKPAAKQNWETTRQEKLRPSTLISSSTVKLQTQRSCNCGGINHTKDFRGSSTCCNDESQIQEKTAESKKTATSEEPAESEETAISINRSIKRSVPNSSSPVLRHKRPMTTAFATEGKQKHILQAKFLFRAEDLSLHSDICHTSKKTSQPNPARSMLRFNAQERPCFLIRRNSKGSIAVALAIPYS